MLYALLLYAYPLGHCVLANLKIPGTCEKQHTKHSMRCARGAMRGALGSLIGGLPWCVELPQVMRGITFSAYGK